MENIIDLKMQKTFPREGELYQQLIAVIDSYAGELSLVAVLGVLDLVKDHVKLD